MNKETSEGQKFLGNFLPPLGVMFQAIGVGCNLFSELLCRFEVLLHLLLLGCRLLRVLFVRVEKADVLFAVTNKIIVIRVFTYFPVKFPEWGS